MSLLDFLAPWVARRIETKKLPAEAERLGLRFHPSDRRDEIGTLDGCIRGHDVLVRPDKPAIEVSYASPIDGLSLSTWSDPRLRRLPIDFDSGVPDFDRRFQSRRATAELSAKLVAHPAFFQRVASFARTWRGTLSQLDFSRATMSAWLKERGDDVCYIKADTLRLMLPEMVGIVEQLEAVAA